MRTRNFIVFLFVPVGVSVLLNAMYFSGILVLQRIVVPNLPPLPIQDWREFGLLENLQHLLLLTVAIMAAVGVYRKRWSLERVAFAGLVLAAIFMLLEETDYGTIYYEFLTSSHDYPWFTPRSAWSPELVTQIPVEMSFSLHNQLDLTDLFKKVSDILLVLIFGILPLVALRVKNVWLQYLAPNRWAIATLIAIYLLREMTHGLGALEGSLMAEADDLWVSPSGRERGAIAKNLSEFRELNRSSA
jgi:hypothetical protein